jgi:hypothetical protein
LNLEIAVNEPTVATRWVFLWSLWENQLWKPDWIIDEKDETSRIADCNRIDIEWLFGQ